MRQTVFPQVRTAASARSAVAVPSDVASSRTIAWNGTAHPNQIATSSVVNACTSTTGWALIAGASLALGTVPDTTYGTVTGLKQTSATNTAAYSDLTLASTLTGRMQVMVYLETFASDPGGDHQNTVNCTVYASNDAGFANYFYRQQTLKLGWNLLSYHPPVSTDSSNEETGWRVGAGSPSWGSNMVRIRFRTEAKASNAVVAYLCGIKDGGKWKAQIPITFDDNLTSAYTVAFPLMQSLGLVGTMYVISSKLDQALYMTTAQVQELYDAGWAICNHTKTHQLNVLPTATQADCYTEINDCTQTLISNGWTRDNCHLHFAAPYGEITYQYATNYRAAVLQAGMLTCRGTVERTIGPYIDDYYTLNSVMPAGTSETATQQNSRIENAVSCGGILPLLFHNIVTPADADIKWTPTDFTTNMNRLHLYKQAGLIDCPTIPQLYRSIGGLNPMAA